MEHPSATKFDSAVYYPRVSLIIFVFGILNQMSYVSIHKIDLKKKVRH